LWGARLTALMSAPCAPVGGAPHGADERALRACGGRASRRWWRSTRD